MELQDIIQSELDELEALADRVATIVKLQDTIQQNFVKPLTFNTEDQEQCLQNQSRLKDLGLLSEDSTDGIFGSQSQNTFTQFKQATNQNNSDKLT
jgi:hypothetical protein